MVSYDTQERDARILHYKMFRTPSIDEFRNGFEYEYVQLSFKDLLTHLPDLDESGRKPGCIFYENWQRGVWGTPLGLQNIKHIKEKMKLNNIRVRNTFELRKMLVGNPLSFHWRKLHIVVFPKKAENEKPTVYINGVLESKLKESKSSKLHDKVFVKSDKEGFRIGFQEFLENNSLNGNIIARYFTGIYHGTENDFAKTTEVFGTTLIQNPPYSNKKHHKGMVRGGYAEAKRIKKEAQHADDHMTIGVALHHKPKDNPSPFVIAHREAKAERRAIQEAYKLIANAKKQKYDLADQKNRKKMSQNVLVCIKDLETKEVFRIPRHVALKQVDGVKYKYVPKHVWQSYTAAELFAAKGDPNIHTTTGTNRKTIRSGMRGPKVAVLPNENRQVIQGSYERDKKDNIVTETVTVHAPDPVYEYLPVFYGKNHPKAGEPFMIYILEDGKKVQVQAQKRTLKVKLKDGVREIDHKKVKITRPVVKQQQKVIIQHNTPSKKTKKGKTATQKNPALTELPEKEQSGVK